LGILFLVGFAMSVVCGMLYKIVPFLLWLHLSSSLSRPGRFGIRLPNMKQFVEDRLIRLQFAIHAAALVLLLSASQPAWGIPLAASAGVALAASSILLGWNLLAALRLYRRHASALVADSSGAA
jgi:hypothetical protein